MITFEEVQLTCLKKTGAREDFKAEWNATRFLVHDKMFALCGEDKMGKRILTVKCEPSLGQSLRQQYSDIVPGYYMNKEHWNSIYLEGQVPLEVLQMMVDQSYELVFDSLSKKVQKSILGY